MDDLVAWLREQLADDEEMATKAIEYRRFPNYTELDQSLTPRARGHIARWDPSRVLAEVEAKRARIDLLAQVAASQMILGPSHANQEVESAFAARLLCLEAQPYASRPGFRDEWRLT